MSGLGALRTYARRRVDRREGDRCELCAARLPDAHAHLVDLGRRTLCCTCGPCALLFSDPAGAYRRVPDRVLADPSLSISEAQWAALEIPVRLAFFFRHSSLGRWVAFYPSPAGATEAELSLAAFGELESSPLVRAVEPDVEALLVRSERPGAPFESLLVPIDACYELVACVRRSWTGFDGGGETRRAIAGFFDGLRARSRPLAIGAPG